VFSRWGDYPQAWPGSEINSGYAADSQSPHCDEARDGTAGIWLHQDGALVSLL
jgi:hypothetical protein